MDLLLDSTWAVEGAEEDRRKGWKGPRKLTCNTYCWARWQVYVQGANLYCRLGLFRTCSKLPADSILLIDRVAVKPSSLHCES